jgi:amidophosphoribosyltransferase
MKSLPMVSISSTPDGFHEECAVVGISGHKEAANLTYLGLYALQHRGQEGSGIVSSDGQRFFQQKGLGLVADIYSKKTLRGLPGGKAIGHNRYSTTGGGDLHNVQPLSVNFAFGNLALAHNGNLVNAGVLRGELEAYGSIFQSDSDSEVIIHLIAHSKGDTIVNRVIDALSLVRGAFSLVLLTDDHLIAARDPYGFRPLSLGRYKESWVVASETCAFDLIDAKFVREVEPGEIVVIQGSELISYHPFLERDRAQCIFEYVYFARPDSKIFGTNAVYPIRKAFGRQLAKECPVEADLVIPVPDSGVPAALGYAEGMGLPFEIGLTRNHYIGRTFIEPQQAIRGTTSRKIVKMLRQAGAKEIHMRISSPPVVAPCFYGIDTPNKKELIGSKFSIEQIRRYVTADSLGYLSLEGMLATAPDASQHYCNACFTDKYPITLTKAEQMQLGLFEPDQVSSS